MENNGFKPLLIEYMRAKNHILKTITGLDIANESDIAEINNEWSDALCGDVLNKLSTIGDGECCPWCLAYSCEVCQYAERHGACCTLYNNSISQYQNIIAELRTKRITSIVNVPEIITLVKATIAKYRRTLLGNT